MTEAPTTLALQVVLVDPPAGYAFCLQRGKGAKAERLDYVEGGSGDLTFELEVEARIPRLRPGEASATMPDFAGPFVQGPRGGRFFYVCIGHVSTVVEPQWTARVKVHLGTINWEHVRASAEGAALRARYVAARTDGRPVTATVPLEGGGWQVVATT